MINQNRDKLRQLIDNQIDDKWLQTHQVNNKYSNFYTHVGDKILNYALRGNFTTYFINELLDQMLNLIDRQEPYPNPFYVFRGTDSKHFNNIDTNIILLKGFSSTSYVLSDTYNYTKGSILKINFPANMKFLSFNTFVDHEILTYPNLKLKLLNTFTYIDDIIYDLMYIENEEAKTGPLDKDFDQYFIIFLHYLFKYATINISFFMTKWTSIYYMSLMKYENFKYFIKTYCQDIKVNNEQIINYIEYYPRLIMELLHNLNPSFPITVKHEDITKYLLPYDILSIKGEQNYTRLFKSELEKQVFYGLIQHIPDDIVNYNMNIARMQIINKDKFKDLPPQYRNNEELTILNLLINRLHYI